ncbi:DUF1561 family protein, partial [Bartonella sp. F02]|uniref:DUF1561 family protein n=1 Tax=Bartonella sp. F02 TaxID=2967262 RepID=UPI0022A90455
HWDWVEWRFCKDSVSSEKDAGYWNISFLNGREGPIKDRNDNYLRVTKYGSNWGVPYTVKREYLKSDTTNSPTSAFVLPYDIENWNHYIYGNLLDSLAYCPAPGYKKDIVSAQSDSKTKLFLPSDFELTEEWLRRLHAISISTSSATIAVGICGTCLLHSYQMLAELEEYYPENPPTSGGYFFDTQPDRDPMLSFNQRYPDLYMFLHELHQPYSAILRPGETEQEADLRLFLTMTQAVLPQFNWATSNIATTDQEVMDSLWRLLMSPPGTVWIASMYYILPGGREGGHAVPIIRSHDGIRIIQTNRRQSFEDFLAQSATVTDPMEMYRLLTPHPHLNMVHFATVQITGRRENTQNIVMSQNNCTGEGRGRRGNRRFPGSASVNQCLSGRCSIL